MQPFIRALEQHEELHRLLHLSMQGIATLRGVPGAVEVLAKLKPEDGLNLGKRLAGAKKQADFAETEVDRGFPTLHAQTLLSLWAIVERLIRELLAVIIENDPDALEIEAIRKLRVRVGELLAYEGYERAYFLVGLLDREVSGPLRHGINRFEDVLASFALSDAVEEDMSRTFFEMQQLRNLHAHRLGYADRTFVDRCPWLDPAEDGYVQVTHEMLETYFEAVAWYTLEIMCRVGQRYGWTREEFEAFLVDGRPTPGPAVDGDGDVTTSGGERNGG